MPRPSESRSNRSLSKAPPQSPEKTNEKSTAESPKPKAKSKSVSYMQSNTKGILSRKTWKEIKHLQNTTHTLIPKLPFQRVLREILNAQKDGLLIQRKAIDALHEAAENFVVDLFQDTYHISLNAKRVTLKVQDVRTLHMTRKDYQYMN